MKNIYVYVIPFFMIILMLLGTVVYADQEIVMQDENMYRTIINQLDESITFEKDDSKKTIKISDDELTKIKKLEINNKEIKNITGLSKFTALEELNISNNNITDISELSVLTNLVKLNAYGCNYKSIKELDTLVNLKELNISRNCLDSSKEEFNGLTDISHLVNLEKLDISFNCFPTLEGASNFKNLIELKAYCNIISNFTGLGELTKLTYLNLGDNNEKGKYTITDESLAEINKLTRLKFLDFSRNKTTNIINNINNLKELEHLSLEENSLTDVTALEEFINLKELILYNNTITNLEPISKLTKLEELVLGRNKVRNIDILFNDGNIVFPNLKKIDLHSNSIADNVSVDAVAKLCDMSNKKQIEFNYNKNITDVSNLPHKDGDIEYVTYEDFGARCDGTYDDFIAIRNAHNFANDKGYEVRATEGKTYHIFKYYEDPVTVRTSVDWNNANVIIHDEDIEYYCGRYKVIFTIKNSDKDLKELKNLDWTVGKNTKKLENLKNEIDALNEKGYNKYLIFIEDSDKKQYIRFGMNANSGANMQDYFLIDSDCNTLNDIQWDFEKITKLQIIPVQNKKYYFKNGNFTTNAIKSQSEIPYVVTTYNKSIYFYRNCNFTTCTNMEVSNIRHTLTTNELSGSYAGFLQFNLGAENTLKDTYLFATKFSLSGKSTYDVTIGKVVNMRVENLDSNDLNDRTRWGIMGTNYSKDVVFDNCRVNRIDAHCGIYNLTVNNSVIGCKGLTLIGQGEFNMYNSRVNAATFITLRADYGSTWNGNMNIVNCTYDFDNATSSPVLFTYEISYDKDGSLHNFGYDCKFPDVYIENLKMDFTKNTRANNIYLFHKSSVKSGETQMEEWYKPNYFLINGYELKNNETKIAKVMKCKYQYDNFDVVYKMKAGITFEEFEKTRNETGFTIKNSKGEEIAKTDKIGTGMKLVMNNKMEYVLAVDGDITGNGEADIDDLAKLKMHLIGKLPEALQGSLSYAADLDNDKEITINDLAVLRLHLI